MSTINLPPTSGSGITTIDGSTPTSINGILKGDGSLISTAVGGVDYQSPLGFTAVPNTRTVNGHALSSDVSVVANDITVTQRQVAATTNLDTSLGNYDDAFFYMSENGFSEWTSGTDASTYSVNGSGFTVLRSGFGFIAGKKVTWAANQTTAPLSANFTYIIYIDTNGSLLATTSTSTAYSNIPLFFCWFDGTNYFVSKENHNYNFASKVSSYLHNTINIVVRGQGCIIGKVGTGTGAAAADRELLISGADVIDDHGLSTNVPAENPISSTVVYLNSSGKWLQYVTQSELPPFYNNAGTPTALNSTPNSFVIYTVYVLQDDINSSSPKYICIMDDASYTTLLSAQSAVLAGSATFATNELKTIESCQLGYAIVGYSATGGYIADVTVARNTFNQALVGGGAGTPANHAFLSNLDFANAGHTGFEPTVTKGNLTEATSSVLTISGGTGAVIGSGASIQVKQSSAGQSGYLSSTDWSTFNNKQASGNYITALTGDVSATGPGSASASISSATVTGKVLTGFSSGAGTVSATDTILQAFNKIVGNLSGYLSLAGGTLTGLLGLKTYTETIQAPGNIIGAVTADWAGGSCYKATLTGSVTFTFSNKVAGESFTVYLEQGGSGSYTVTWPTTKWAGGVSPTLSTTVGKIDIISFNYDGTNLYGFVGGVGF